MFQLVLSGQPIDYVGPLTDWALECAGLTLIFKSTDADLKAFLKTHLYPGATDAQINSIADKYSEDPSQVRHYSELVRATS